MCSQFRKRLMKAVGTAPNNKMLEMEYMSYYANMHDKYNEGLKAGHDEGLKTGLIAMVEISCLRIQKQLFQRKTVV